MLLLEPQNTPATLLDAATAAVGATGRSCNAAGHCNRCCWSHRTLLQRCRTLQLLLPEPQDAPATLQDTATAAARATGRPCNTAGRCNCWCRSHRTLCRTLQLLAPEPQDAPATLQDAATAGAGATGRSCNAAGRCNCCCWGHWTLLQRCRTLQLLVAEPQENTAGETS